MQSDQLRRGFLEAIQQWLRPAIHDNRMIKDVAALPNNKQPQQSDNVDVKERTVWLKDNDKTNVITAIPSRYNDP